MKPTFILIAVCFLFVSAFAKAADDWVLEIEKEGIRVYTQLDAGSPYKQVKVTTTIDASMERVLEILMSFGHYKNWMYHVTESYLINRSDEETYYVFTLEDASWPMQNRYQVSRVNVEQSSTEATVRFRSVPNYIEKRTDAIQIKQNEGYWSLKSRPNHQCTLEYVIIQNPGGHVPPWLANFNAVENPYFSVMNLKKQAERENLRP
ncbi:MAG TPA: hypothetical protein VMZ69_00445 [Saprospiraceae bacterium]|nr:hypothetical protein [Saprospiraceae bacterium]